jgi:rhodanese-related sulfurtransferase
MKKLVQHLLLVLLILLLPALAMAKINDLKLSDIESLVSQKPDAGKYMLVDARPEIKFAEGYIPWAVSIPKQELKERLAELPKDKATKLVFYCGGVKCKLSTESAKIAEEAGYTNVYTFSTGMPAWKKAGNTPWVSAQHIKMVLNDPKRIALIIDARPALKYNVGTVPGALSIPFQQFDALKGLLPADKSAQVIYFCGGFKCNLSHKSAKAARELGYTNVVTFAAGWPAWKKASKRAFAMVDPNNKGAAAPAAEAMVVEGEIDAGSFEKMVKNPSKKTLIVDVRPADEFEQGHLPGAINILDETVGKNAKKFKKFDKVVFYCNTGSRAAIAFYEAEAVGLKDKCSFLNKNVVIEADGTYAIN